MNSSPSRRSFLSTTAVGLATTTIASSTASAAPKAKPPSSPKAPLYKISLAQWSLHKTLFAKQLDNLDFAKTASNLGFDAIEFVNQFFKDKAKDRPYLADLKKRSADEGVWNVLIMIDGEGSIGAKDEAKRKQTVENHKKWVDAAAYIGCHTIRVNAGTEAGFDEGIKLAADGLRRLCEYADPIGISVIVENHGGLSSNADWLTKVMKAVDHPRCGTLPDFGNFRIKDGEEYDKYKGVELMMPFAKSVSAKSHNFDKKGNEVTIDYARMMKLVTAAGYRGYCGVEYDGTVMPEIDGILATKRLLERVRGQLSG